MPDVDLSSYVADPSVDGWDIALALIVLLLSWIVSRIAGRAVRSITNRVEGVPPDVVNLASRVVRTFVIVIGIGVALSTLGADIRPVLAAAIIVGIVMALALRGIAENWAAGVVIQTRRPLAVGDTVDLGEHSGTVLEVNGSAVVIETFDGAVVHVPNADTLANPIVNRTAGRAPFVGRDPRGARVRRPRRTAGDDLARTPRCQRSARRAGAAGGVDIDRRDPHHSDRHVLARSRRIADGQLERHRRPVVGTARHRPGGDRGGTAARGSATHPAADAGRRGEWQRTTVRRAAWPWPP